MRVEEAFEQWAAEQNFIAEGGTVIVGVSGGADSVCLLYLMKEYAQEKGFKCIAVHFNHMIRGERAELDEAFVKTLCAQMDVRCMVAKANVPELAERAGLSEEETGRVLRYKAFAKAAKSVSGIIAVAHHKDDNAETILMNLVRGSNVKGLTGMQPVAEFEGCLVVRPLLSCSHEEIVEFLKEKDIDFVEDETNQDLAYSRNRVRGIVLPELKKVNSKATEHIVLAAEDFGKIEAYLAQKTEEAFADVVSEEEGEVLIHAEKLLGLEEVIQSRVLYSAIGKATGELKDISRVHVEELFDLCSKQSGRKIDLPYDCNAVKQYEYVIIRSGEAEEESFEEVELDISEENLYENIYETELEDGTVVTLLLVPVDEGNRKVLTQKNEYTKAFDYDTIKGNIILGKRASGDVISLKDGSKSLKKFFIDEKIPAEDRKNVLVLKDEESVLWVVGYRIGENFKITENTKRALLVKISGGNYGRKD
ncbi:MAG: tRNA lysidine(34) synthetase TilS [Lachnospiraceae bacterium]|nr:tRNA lysidine(34) synthetase TilS [Lachnospiraceae bacterium]